MARRLIATAGLALLMAIPLLLLRFDTAAQQPPVARTIALGQIVRALLTGYSAPLGVAVDSATGRVFVTDAADDTMSIVNGRGGDAMRVVGLDQPAGNPYASIAAAVDERHGRLITVAGETIAIRDERSGSALHTTSIGDTPLSLAVDAPRDHLVAADGLGHALYLLDARSGTVLRAIPTSHAVNSIVVVARTARIFTGSSTGVRVFDARSGTLLHTIHRGTSPTFVNAVDDHTNLVIATNSFAHTVTLLDGRSGRVRRVIRVPGLLLGVSVNGLRDRIFVLGATTPDGIAVIDERSGAVLRTIALGGTPYALAVDERAGRVYVVDSGGVVVTPDPWRDVPPWVPRQLQRWLPFLPQPGVSVRTMPPSLIILDDRNL